MAAKRVVAYVEILLVPNKCMALDFDKFGIIIEPATNIETGEFFHATHVFYGDDRMDIFMDHCETMYDECMRFSVSIDPRYFWEIKRVFLNRKQVHTDELLGLIEKVFPKVVKAYVG